MRFGSLASILAILAITNGKPPDFMMIFDETPLKFGGQESSEPKTPWKNNFLD